MAFNDIGSTVRRFAAMLALFVAVGSCGCTDSGTSASEELTETCDMEMLQSSQAEDQGSDDALQQYVGTARETTPGELRSEVVSLIEDEGLLTSPDDWAEKGAFNSYWWVMTEDEQAEAYANAGSDTRLILDGIDEESGGASWSAI